MKNFSICALCVLIVNLAAAQIAPKVFTQGNITVTVLTTAWHDSTSCRTVGRINDSIVIQNSTLGATLKIINASNLFTPVVYTDTNTTGQSTWTVVYPTNPYLWVSDQDIDTGIAHYQGSVFKIISGIDTLYQVPHSFDLPVYNPCEYEVVEGKVFADYNNNCIFDSSDISLDYMWMELSMYSTVTVSTRYYTMVEPNARYSCEVQKSWMQDVTINPKPEYRLLFRPSGCQAWEQVITTVPQYNVDFALQCGGEVDLRCDIFSPVAVRPSVPFMLHPSVNNLGCNPMSGLLKLVLDSRVTYNASLSNGPPSSVSGDTLTWYYSNLTNFKVAGGANAFFAGIHLTPDSSVNIGDSLCFFISTAVPGNDVDSASNQATLCIPVVNSYDPNIKEATPAGMGQQGIIPPSTTDLTYTIHFQNTGNAPALTVKVVDTLSAMLDRESIHVIGATHEMKSEMLNDSVVRFTFSNINLADSASNEPASHGALTFGIKLNSSLPLGTQIKNRAGIYFDNNPPIITNTKLHTIESPQAVNEPEKATDFIVFPNPTTGNVDIKTGQLLTDYSIRLLSVEGKTLMTYTGLTGNRFTINTSSVAAGMYFVEVSGKDILSRVKLLKVN